MNYILDERDDIMHTMLCLHELQNILHGALILKFQDGVQGEGSGDIVYNCFLEFGLF